MMYYCTIISVALLVLLYAPNASSFTAGSSSLSSSKKYIIKIQNDNLFYTSVVPRSHSTGAGSCHSVTHKRRFYNHYLCTVAKYNANKRFRLSLSSNDEDVAIDKGTNKIRLTKGQTIENVINERVRQEGVKKDKELDRLTSSLNQRKTELNRLKFQLMEFKTAIEENDVQTEKEEENLKKIEADSDGSTIESASNEVTAKLSQEKEALSKELQSAEDELSRIDSVGREELENFLSNAEIKKKDLEKEIDSLENKLQQQQLEALSINIAVDEGIKTSNIEIKRQKLEEKRRQNEIYDKLREERRQLRNTLWDLETELQRVRYVYIVESSKKKREEKENKNDLKKAVVELETQLNKMEESFKNQTKTLKDELEMEEMKYASDREKSPRKIGGLVRLFRNRMRRREKVEAKRMESLQNDMTDEMESARKMMEIERNRLVRAKDKDIAKSVSMTKEFIDSEVRRYDRKVVYLDKKVKMAERSRTVGLEKINLKTKKKLDKTFTKAQEEKTAILLEKDSEIELLKKESSQAYTKLILEMKERMGNAAKELEELGGVIQAADYEIKRYEEEKTSLRRLIKTTLTVALRKPIKLINRRRNRKLDIK